MKIGLVAVQTGPQAALGTQLRDGFLQGLKHLDGKLGGLAAEIVPIDDELRPEVAVTKVRAALERDKVDVVVGVVFSNILAAIMRPVTESGTFLISTNAGPSTFAGRGCNPNFFTTSYNNDQVHSVMGQAAQDAGHKRVFVMVPNYQAGRDAVAGFKSRFKGEVVDEVYVPLTQLDFSAELAKIAASKPDALFTFMPGGLGVNLVRQYRQAGLAGIPFLSTFTVDEATLPAQQEAALGFFSAASWAPNMENAANTRFVRDFEASYGYVPASYAAQSYDAAMLLNSAIRKVGGNLAGKDALREALRAADFQSVRGSFTAPTTTRCRTSGCARWRSAPTASSRPRRCGACWRPTSTPGLPNAGCADPPMSFGLLLVQGLNGLQFGVLLFLVAAGLTLVFGVMDFINLAHGVQYMLGAYLGASLASLTGSFWGGLLLALPATLASGLVLEWLVFRHLYDRDHLSQVLATFGVILFLNEAVKLAWGTAPLQMAPPELLAGGITLLPGLQYPAYRLAILAAGLATAGLLWLLVERTRVGALVRAGATNAAMVAALGVDIRRLFMLVFGFGAMLAGFAGVMAAPILSVEPGMGDGVLILAFVVIVIGGIGSVRGAFVAALLVGLVESLGRSLLPDLLRLVMAASPARQAGAAIGSMLVYAVMALILAVRPRGLFPVRG
ncbi:ABC transporter substrate-binding protein [Paeniroseomonas aquatica]